MKNKHVGKNSDFPLIIQNREASDLETNKRSVLYSKMIFLNISKSRLHCISAEFFVCHTLTCIVTHLKSLQLNMVLEGSFKGQLVLRMDLRVV